MEPIHSLPCLNRPATGPYSKPKEFIIKFSWATSRANYLKYENINLSKNISVLVLRVLIWPDQWKIELRAESCAEL